MGIFKTIRDTQALGDHHRVEKKSIRGSFADMAKMVDDRGEGDILATGVPATAVVKGMPTPVAGDRHAVSVLVEVQRPGQPPYDVDYVFPATRMKAGLMPGTTASIRVDPADPARIAVDWDAPVASAASIGTQGGGMNAAVFTLGSAYSGTADAAMRQAMGQTTAAPAAPAADADPAARLTKLAALRDAGAITDDEFAAKRAEILDAI